MSSSSSESAAQETQTQSQGEALSQAPPASATQAGQRKENCFWASTEDEKLLDVLEEGKQQGKASGGGFKPELWVRVLEEIEPLHEKGRKKALADVKNHYRNLKAQYKEVKELVDMSGFGWDEDKGVATADDAVWDDLVKRRPELKKWRHKSFPFYTQLDSLNSKSTATGALSRDVGAEGEASSDSENDSEKGDKEGSDDENDGQIPASRKRKRPSGVGALAEIATALRGMSNQDEGLGEAITELLDRDSEAFEVDELASLGLALADKPRLASVYKSFAERPDLRQGFLRKILDSDA
ncbi:unnamed protein product [Tilletia laevis]|uniref:Myb/SANT-like domain-containing protein n=3 Tax=Tilletia TaxID=13289 RepID=A0A8X7MJC9_9BASI|nr:hypothetical protein CF328_g8115 [Tilletia controversa]KAE8184599.1 hypothetical protein CF335_g7971 [Tilletia laevis]KAE8242821.1 hypothetical protein A4X03_0g7958 [Tilletia caries]KAE8238389.1 hypothetical protein A4X06_0g8796 [Tilletia controversa]CAD6933524.1 unnamed protein product [Tilletia caries]